MLHIGISLNLLLSVRPPVVRQCSEPTHRRTVQVIESSESLVREIFLILNDSELTKSHRQNTIYFYVYTLLRGSQISPRHLKTWLLSFSESTELVKKSCWKNRFRFRFGEIWKLLFFVRFQKYFLNQSSEIDMLGSKRPKKNSRSQRDHFEVIQVSIWNSGSNNQES